MAPPSATLPDCAVCAKRAPYEVTVVDQHSGYTVRVLCVPHAQASYDSDARKFLDLVPEQDRPRRVEVAEKLCDPHPQSWTYKRLGDDDDRLEIARDTLKPVPPEVRKGPKLGL